METTKSIAFVLLIIGKIIVEVVLVVYFFPLTWVLIFVASLFIIGVGAFLAITQV